MKNADYLEAYKDYLVEEGMPIEEIAKFMGQTNIEMTRIYLTKPQSYYKDRINKLSFVNKKRKAV